MRTIKFVCNNIQEKQFADELQKNVYDYFRLKGISIKGNFSLVIKTIIMLSVYIVPFIILLTVSMYFWVAILLVILLGIGMAGVGMCVMHDASHGSYSSKVWVNKILSRTMYLLGSNVFNWRIQHTVMHHTYTNINGFDEDVESRGPIRLSQHVSLRKFHHYQYIHAFFFYGLMTISKTLAKDINQLIEYNKAGILRKFQINPAYEYTKTIIIKLIYLFIFIGVPVIFSQFNWWQVLLGFLIMHWVAGSILSIFFQLAHMVEGVSQPLPNVEGVINSEWAVHELLTTSDFARNNLFLNWYIGGLNFQIEHHLFSNISHVHYRKIAPIIEKTAKQFGINYNLKPTFINALISHIRILKKLGTQISFNN